MNPRILIYWILVGLPLGWGVYQSVMKSLPLFGIGSVPAATAPAKPVEPDKK